MQRDRAEATLNIMSHEPVILTQTRGRKLQLATIEATPANPPKPFSKHRLSFTTSTGPASSTPPYRTSQVSNFLLSSREPHRTTNTIATR
ncbi:hypothetical protein Bca52824_007109 [Brassica carinata]|uniref:Uncharacterized protein n=1 Tax=Brassica carinata TaxID=52824 RepID=A0A8X7W6F0_BRACI|nr:hypothetical protein Bca52824_007109 [Brassica carinata]